MATPDTNDIGVATLAHWKYGQWSVAAGIAGLLAVVLIVLTIGKGDGAVAIIGAVASPIVAMVSVYFGVSAAATTGATGQQNVKDAGDAATAAALLADPNAPESKGQLQSLVDNLTARSK